MTEKTLIINSEKVSQKIERMAYEILENNFEESELHIVGIQNRGYKIAKILFEKLDVIADAKVFLHALSIDKTNAFDASKITLSNNLNQLTDKTVIVVDDVLNSGKTLMYAVKYILGANLKRLNTAILVDRRHRNYPIRADYAGLTLSTTLQEHISVEFSKKGTEVYLS